MVQAHTAKVGQFLVVNSAHHFINSVERRGDGSGLVILGTTAGVFTQLAGDLIEVR
jgi:hypothetical protein